MTIRGTHHNHTYSLIASVSHNYPSRLRLQDSSFCTGKALMNPLDRAGRNARGSLARSVHSQLGSDRLV
jgi:hypothetical protein